MNQPTLHGYDHGNENSKISTDPDDDNQNIYRPAKDVSLAEDGLEDLDCMIRKIKLKNMNNPTFVCINVNSIQYKHADLFAVINSNLLGVLSIAETKLDSSFPNAQFLVDEYNGGCSQVRKQIIKLRNFIKGLSKLYTTTMTRH